MKEIIQEALQSPALICMTIILFITGSITTFDIRLTQAIRRGQLPKEHPELPWWVAFLYWIHYGLIICLFFINWKYATILFIALFVLKVLPVLETFGNIMMAPFKPREGNIFSDIPMDEKKDKDRQDFEQNGFGDSRESSNSEEDRVLTKSDL